MKNYPKHIKSTLFSVIHDMAKHPENFCRCPEKDFTRNRKLPFEKLLTLFVKMGGHSLRDEMLDCLDFKELPASVSALVQQRSKLLPEALEYLFREFTNRCHNPKLYKGYRLLAVNCRSEPSTCVHRSSRSPRPAELSGRSAEIEQWHRPD